MTALTASLEPGVRRFEFQYSVKVAPHEQDIRVWMPVPSSDAHQTIGGTLFDLGGSQRVLLTECDGNRVLYLELPSSERESRIRLTFSVERRRRTTDRESADVHGEALEMPAPGRYLGSDRRVPVEGEFGNQAKAVVSEKAEPLEKARRLFDHVLATYAYDSSGCTPDKGDALGDLQVACDLKLGTCTELHGLLVAYLRAVGVPARFAFGFNLARQPRGQVGGYHCWAEAYLPRFGWFPMDVSEARKRAPGTERDFYFGNLDENRVQFSMDRDVILSPMPLAGPIDKLIFPLCESPQKTCSIAPEFLFRDLSSDEVFS